MATVDLCLIADIRTQSEIPTTTTTPDALLTPLITAASREIARRYEREFISEASGATTRTFRVDGYYVTLTPYDLRAAPTSVVLHPEASSPQTLAVNVDYAWIPGAATTGWKLRLANQLNLASTFAGSFGFAQLAITGTAAAHWGIYANTAGVPDDVRHAAVLTVTSWLDRGVSSYGVQGVESDGVIRPDVFMGWPIPAAAHFILQHFEPVKVF